MVNIEEICIVVHTETNYLVHSIYLEERFQVVRKGYLLVTLGTSHCTLTDYSLRQQITNKLVGRDKPGQE